MRGLAVYSLCAVASGAYMMGLAVSDYPKVLVLALWNAWRCVELANVRVLMVFR